MDEHARIIREARIPKPRRQELDALVESLLERVTEQDERRYVVDRLRNEIRRRGRPESGRAELDRWRADAERLGDDPKVLAREWGITPKGALRRLKTLGGNFNRD
jgi:hypothetical protein